LSGFDFTEHERAVAATAEDVLPALAAARQASTVLAEAIRGTTVARVGAVPAPPEYWVRAATLQLAVIAFRSARACMLVVSHGYWVEAHGLKRRLSEVHARAQAMAHDTSGQHARQWLDGKPPKIGPIMEKFGSSVLWDVYSWSAHADSRGVHAWLSTAIEGAEADTALNVVPCLDVELANSLLTEIATECRDMAMAIVVVRSETEEERTERMQAVRALDAQIKALIDRYWPARDDDTPT
jgi:hypothetical protein